mgnify:CR=1 FL=1
MKAVDTYKLSQCEIEILECVAMYAEGTLKGKEAFEYIKDYMKEMKSEAKNNI